MYCTVLCTGIHRYLPNYCPGVDSWPYSTRHQAGRECDVLTFKNHTTISPPPFCWDGLLNSCWLANPRTCCRLSTYLFISSYPARLPACVAICATPIFFPLFFSSVPLLLPHPSHPSNDKTLRPTRYLPSSGPLKYATYTVNSATLRLPTHCWHHHLKSVRYAICT